MSEEYVGGNTAGGARRAPRRGVGGSPVGSTLSIVLAVVAVIAGFLILRNITSEESATTSDPGTELLPSDVTTTTFDAGVTTTAAVVAPTTVPLVTEGATVVVANGNTIGGSAGRMSETLGGIGFTMGSATNGNATIDESIVYYDPSNPQAEAVANSVARMLGGVQVQTLPTPAPTESGSLDDGAVLVLLGNNQADKTLEVLGETAATTPMGTSPLANDTTTTVAAGQ